MRSPYTPIRNNGPSILELVAHIESLPARQFIVSTDPATAVTTTCRFLHSRGYAPEPFNLDAALLSEGDAARGWTGATLYKGNWTASLVSEFLVEAIPLLLLIPSLRRHHDRIRIAVLARPTADARATDLYCAFVSVDARILWFSPKSEAVSAFNALPQTFTAEGIEIEGPTPFPSAGRHPNHPLHPRHWRRLVQSMRRHRRHPPAE